ncbi:MAG: hypothetical protein IRZ18_00340 [Clostridia bacterium]|nr:hypothetical protein [Clostridia bacterium]
MHRRATMWTWVVVCAGLAVWAAGPGPAAPFGFEPGGGPAPSPALPAWAEGAGRAGAHDARPRLIVWSARPQDDAQAHAAVEAWRASLAAWQRRNPRWKVDLVVWPATAAARRLADAVAAGRPPDVYLGPLPDAPVHAVAAALDPLVGAAARRALGHAAPPVVTAGGHVWALPACAAGTRALASPPSFARCMWVIVPRRTGHDAAERLRAAAEAAAALSDLRDSLGVR